MTVQRNGAEVSATTEGEGPRKSRPSLSIETSSASPFRKSAWVDTVQNVADAAPRPAAPTISTAAAAAMTAADDQARRD